MPQREEGNVRYVVEGLGLWRGLLRLKTDTKHKVSELISQIVYGALFLAWSTRHGFHEVPKLAKKIKDLCDEILDLLAKDSK